MKQYYKKGDFRPGNFLVSLLLFGLVFTVCVLMIADMNANYGLSLETDQFNDTFNTINETYSIAIGQEAEVLKSDIEGGETTSASMLRGSFSAIRLMSGTLQIFKDVITELSKVFGIHPVFIQTGMAALIILITFAAIQFVRGVRA